MEYDDKTLALAKFLKIDPALIENNYTEYYTINERTVKEGTTPEQFKKIAEDFRSLLNKEMQEVVTGAIIKPHSKVKVKKDDVEIERDLSDVAYESVSEYLEPMEEKAKKRAEQLARLDVDSWKPPIKEKPEDVYNRLKEDNLYVVNVLYHLVKNNDFYNEEYCDSLRRAWLGQPISDTRKDRVVNDGEYLVLTDSEADAWEEDGLRSLFDDMIPRDIRDSFIGNYLDEDKFVEDNSGNRGENINGYDGNEEQVEFEGTTYFIYRNN